MLALFTTTLTATADTLQIAPAAQSAASSMPKRGMTMKAVEQTYGSPLSRKSPVGDPPITRWEYNSFVVYFEYKRVIHAVAKRTIPTQ